MIKARPIEEADWQEVWQIIKPVFRAGETYPYPMDITEDEARRNWIDAPSATYVVVDENEDVLGTYYIKPNQPGLGAHVANCGYIVSENARGPSVKSADIPPRQNISLVMPGIVATRAPSFCA